MTESVTRYVATYKPPQGSRTLMCAAQGRNTYATAAEAQAWLDAVTSSNAKENLDQLFGTNPQFEVRPCQCWPGHFDPIGVWFGDNDDSSAA